MFDSLDPNKYLRSQELQTSKDVLVYVKTYQKDIGEQADKGNVIASQLIILALAFAHLLEDHACSFLEQILGNLLIDCIEQYEQSIGQTTGAVEQESNTRYLQNRFGERLVGYNVPSNKRVRLKFPKRNFLTGAGTIKGLEHEYMFSREEAQIVLTALSRAILEMDGG